MTTAPDITPTDCAVSGSAKASRREIYSGSEEDDGRETSKAPKGSGEPGANNQGFGGARGGEKAFTARGKNWHGHSFRLLCSCTSVYRGQDRCSVAVSEEIEIAKDGPCVIFLHETSARAINAVYFDAAAGSNRQFGTASGIGAMPEIAGLDKHVLLNFCEGRCPRRLSLGTYMVTIKYIGIRVWNIHMSKLKSK